MARSHSASARAQASPTPHTIEPVADTRECAYCGAVFAPRREHARFCSPGCRLAWDEKHARLPAIWEGTLDWAVTAMRETVAELLAARGTDHPDVFEIISSAVWWVTMVDATLVRYQPASYAAVLARYCPDDRQALEDTLAGLRFVRNQMGYRAAPDTFVCPGPDGPEADGGPIAAWTWRPVRQPALASLPLRGQEWELGRYRAYQARLAGTAVGDTFRCADDFLPLAATGREDG
jgi:hypothetical protein